VGERSPLVRPVNPALDGRFAQRSNGCVLFGKDVFPEKAASLMSEKQPKRIGRGFGESPGGAVRLRDVIEAMDLPDPDWRSYLNPGTGEITTVSSEDRQLVEDGANVDDLPAWQSEMLPKIREALESGQFLALPDNFDVHEWSIMERFAQDRRSAPQRDELLGSLRGRGAFRSFRSAVRSLGIEDDWHQFRDAALEEIAKDWLEEHDIPYK